MFDRLPDAALVADLAAVQEMPPESSAAAAASSLIEQLMGWDRVAAWVEAQRLDVMRRFVDARSGADRELVAGAEPGEQQCGADQWSASHKAAVARLEASLDETAGKFAAEEVALALGISPTSASRQLALARDLHEVHHDLSEALHLGQVSPFVAMMVAQATRRLPVDARQTLDEAVTTDAVELTAGRAIEAARNRVAEVDLDADLRTRLARDSRHAFLKPLPDDLAMLAAVMPAEEAVQAWRTVDQHARRLRSSGDPRTLDQLRCDAIAEFLVSPPVAPSAGVPAVAAEQDATTDDEPTERTRGRSRPTVSVQVVISLSTLLGLDSRSAHLEGYGAINARAVGRILASGEATLSRLLCDPLSGAVMVADPARYSPTAGLIHATTCRDRHCRMPVCDARVRDLDHIQAAADAGLTSESNLHGLCERSHLAKHHPGWHVEGDATGVVTWTTPTGRRYPSLPPPATGYGTGPPRAPDDEDDINAWWSSHQRLQAALRDRHSTPASAA
ncbi:MAG: DUF222 domain-containing protein [Nocardioidaceae bacterium]